MVMVMVAVAVRKHAKDMQIGFVTVQRGWIRGASDVLQWAIRASAAIYPAAQPLTQQVITVTRDPPSSAHTMLASLWRYCCAACKFSNTVAWTWHELQLYTQYFAHLHKCGMGHQRNQARVTECNLLSIVHSCMILIYL